MKIVLEHLDAIAVARVDGACWVTGENHREDLGKNGGFTWENGGFRWFYVGKMVGLGGFTWEKLWFYLEKRLARGFDWWWTDSLDLFLVIGFPTKQG